MVIINIYYLSIRPHGAAWIEARLSQIWLEMTALVPVQSHIRLQPRHCVARIRQLQEHGHNEWSDWLPLFCYQHIGL